MHRAGLSGDGQVVVESVTVDVGEPEPVRVPDPAGGDLAPVGPARLAVAVAARVQPGVYRAGQGVELSRTRDALTRYLSENLV
ncbi:hypothetical protein ABZW18_28585 [Streptomyces sp. NPDC004647]|uniref:hypothetical protein n=1 Tax=Streptomyces sp. NPDC004647 TaxID=3154671 RepID=UPI0033B06DCC